VRNWARASLYKKHELTTALSDDVTVENSSEPMVIMQGSSRFGPLHSAHNFDGHLSVCVDPDAKPIKIALDMCRSELAKQSL
jgi:hypothetical protein